MNKIITIPFLVSLLGLIERGDTHYSVALKSVSLYEALKAYLPEAYALETELNLLKDFTNSLEASKTLYLNHPGGKAEFSKADIDLTQKLFSGLKFLEVELLDHILFYGTGHLSMRGSSLWNEIK